MTDTIQHLKNYGNSKTNYISKFEVLRAVAMIEKQEAEIAELREELRRQKETNNDLIEHCEDLDQRVTDLTSELYPLG